MNDILTFTFVALLLVISPGPNGILVLKTATVHGRNSTIVNLLGITSATFCHGALSIFGLSTLILQSADMFLAVKLLGATYLFYIGVKAVYQSYKNNAVSGSDYLATETPAKEKTRGIVSFYSEGFLTQMLNPKVSMFYMAAFPQFVSFEIPSYGAAFVLVLIHATMIFFWFLAATLAIDKVKKLSEKPSLSRWVQRLSGCLMIYFSSLLVAQKI